MPSQFKLLACPFVKQDKPTGVHKPCLEQTSFHTGSTHADITHTDNTDMIHTDNALTDNNKKCIVSQQKTLLSDHIQAYHGGLA